jgi:hypothetical protein
MQVFPIPNSGSTSQRGWQAMPDEVGVWPRGACGARLASWPRRAAAGAIDYLPPLLVASAFVSLHVAAVGWLVFFGWVGVSSVYMQAITGQSLGKRLTGAPARPRHRAPRRPARRAIIRTRTSRNTPAPEGSQNPGPREAGRKNAETRKPTWRRLASWAIPLLVGAILISFVVPGAHNGLRVASCFYKFATSPGSETPASSDWVPYGTSLITDASAFSVSVRPDPSMGAQDEWFGASLAVTSYCDYRIEFWAMLTGPLYPVPGAGYGYAVGSRGEVVNGVPYATTIQYDPPFHGLRTVNVPSMANASGFNPTPFASVDTGRYHHWIITVERNRMLATLDGKPYQPVDLDTGFGNQIIIRVWNSEVHIRDMRISSIRPTL